MGAFSVLGKPLGGLKTKTVSPCFTFLDKSGVALSAFEI